MNIPRKWLAAGLVALAIIVPLALKRPGGGSGTAVEISPAALQAVRPSILASGLLAFEVEVNLTAEVLARVASIAVQEGDVVEKGQLLMRLDPETYNNIITREEAGVRQNRISIERQRAVVALRRQQYERSQKLAASNLIDRNRLDEDRNQSVLAEADLKSAEEALQRAISQLADAREQRSKTEIRAPIAGRIVSLPIKAGEVAIPSTASLAGAQLMKIADTSAIQAEVKVDEGDIAKIKLDQSADVFAAAYQDTALTGKVTKIALAPTIDGQGRSYRVTLALSPPAGLQLRSGMSARAVIYLGDGQRSLAVPVESVITESPERDVVRRSVWVDVAGKARKTEITTGLSDDRWETVVSGIKAGDRIITGPSRVLRRLKDGDAIRPMEAKDRPKDEEDGATDAAGADSDG
jgi:HlyD family secretion protein